MLQHRFQLYINNIPSSIISNDLNKIIMDIISNYLNKTIMDIMDLVINILYFSLVF